MTAKSTLRVNLVWFGLLLLTVTSWVLASVLNSSRLGPDTVVTVTVVAIAGVKAAGIISEFMEVRMAPRGLRAIAGVWLVAMVASIIALYVD